MPLQIDNVSIADSLVKKNSPVRVLEEKSPSLNPIVDNNFLRGRTGERYVPIFGTEMVKMQGNRLAVLKNHAGQGESGTFNSVRPYAAKIG